MTFLKKLSNHRACFALKETFNSLNSFLLIFITFVFLLPLLFCTRFVFKLVYSVVLVYSVFVSCIVVWV